LQKPEAAAFLDQLTPAEQRVFKFLCRGYPNEKISQDLFISRNTVKFHVRNILRKAGVQNRYELLAKIIKEEETTGNTMLRS